jgi:hypothetical protein
MVVSMLTTVDNPHDPFDDFEAWDVWDRQAGYHTNSFLARIATTSDDLPDSENDFWIEKAIDEIVEENVLGIYKKVTREV